MTDTGADTIEEKLRGVQLRIEKARANSQVSAPRVQLLAVSKNQTVEKMEMLRSALSKEGGLVVFGESYAQELREKRSKFEDCRFHFIGRIQKNKVRQVVEYANVVESVDSAELALLLDKEARKQGKTLDAFLQVNISGDPAKSGFNNDEVVPFINATLPALTSLRVKGLMTIVFLYDEPEAARKDYRSLRLLRDELVANEQLRAILGTSYLELSMGMSDDFEVAIEEGATEVRVGTALFGPR